MDISSSVYVNSRELLVKRVNHRWNCCHKSSGVIPVLVMLMRRQKCYPACKQFVLSVFLVRPGACLQLVHLCLQNTLELNCCYGVLGVADNISCEQ